MQINKQHQLTYCTNIHPGSNWQETFTSLKNNLPAIKKQLAPNQPFGLGLRLSNKASAALGLGETLNQFKAWLAAEDCYVFTMNGFPYGNFHGERVKDNVHAPDWTTPERLTYTLRLFDQLSVLLPQGMEGGISTSPISYKHWHTNPLALQEAFSKGAANMVVVALKLYQIEQQTGQYLHLDIEPEPDGLLENTAEVLHFFEQHLLPAGEKAFTAIGVAVADCASLVKRYLTLCYDVCHFSLAYEAPELSFAQLEAKQIRVGKIQISAALKILFDGKEDAAIWQALQAFDEPVYLHQVTQLLDGKVKTFADLPKLPADQQDFSELRAHFHVPIFVKDFGVLKSTQDQILHTLAYLKKHPTLCSHLEVETYTWEVLPTGLKLPLVDSVVRELQWVKDRLG